MLESEVDYGVLVPAGVVDGRCHALSFGVGRRRLLIVISSSPL
jgi:hypothetical protein